MKCVNVFYNTILCITMQHTHTLSLSLSLLHTRTPSSLPLGLYRGGALHCVQRGKARPGRGLAGARGAAAGAAQGELGRHRPPVPRAQGVCVCV